jgi:MFS family permease
VTVTSAAPELRAARNAVTAVFFLNGFAFATWASRLPDTRASLHLGPGALGALVLMISLGSVLALPATGMWVQRFGAAKVVTVAALVDGSGLLLAGVGAGLVRSVVPTGAGLLLLGLGSGAWDVAMNVEGAAVERRLNRSIMPRFHAAWSLGTVSGAGIGALVTYLGAVITWHAGLVALLVGGLPVVCVRRFLAPEAEQVSQRRASALSAWTEPRTLLLGLLVLAMALTEGVANDWLAVGLVSGYGVPAWVGAAGFALFVTSMTTGRVLGTTLLDRYGRLPVLWASMAVAAVGVLLVVLGRFPAVVVVGIVCWGVGACLGFPIGMSAAADEPSRAAARVSVVSTLGYAAFLAGPPVLGFLGSQFGILPSLLLVSVLLVPSALAVPAARPPAPLK